MDIYLVDRIFYMDWDEERGYYHNCSGVEDQGGWIIEDNKCFKCGKEAPSQKKLDVMRGLKELVG